MILIYRALLCMILPLAIVACSDSSDSRPGPYADDALWLCKPGATSNRCLELDQTTTYVYEDDNRAVFEHEPATDPEFDCFYVYPTVDFNEEPGNMTDLSDDTLMLRPLYNQAARFTQLCKVYAPKYQQMTYSSYGVENVFESEYFQLAYADVEKAFDQYLLENPRRNFVLMGHSQGSHILLELLQRRFDDNEGLRKRLISALTIGATGRLKVPPGETTGSMFENIPLCTHATDTGCIVAYDSIAGGGEEQRPEVSQPRACVNPTLLGGDSGIMDTIIYNRDEGIPFPEGVETHWIAYPGLLSASCERDGYLAIDTAPGRTAPIPPQVIQLVLGGSLHQADYNFAMGDLLRIVETQAGSMP